MLKLYTENPLTGGDVAIITARSGSKRLPGKNIMDLNGLPLMAWTIKAALASGLFERVMVSTDSSEYAETAKAYGAEVPWLRGEHLAGDDISSADVVADVLKNLSGDGYFCKSFMLLQPTSPLRTAGDMKEARALFDVRKAHAVVSVCKMSHHPTWCNILPEDLNMVDFLPPRNVMEIEAEKIYYRINGAIYLSDVPEFLRTHSFFPSQTYALIMPGERSVDIDEAIDFTLAEVLMKKTLI